MICSEGRIYAWAALLVDNEIYGSTTRNIITGRRFGNINTPSAENSLSYTDICLTRMFHELLSRDHEDGLATRQPQGVGSEAYLSSTSQDPTPEDAWKDGHIRGRSK